MAENQEHDDRMHVVIMEIYHGIVVSSAVVILDRPGGRKSRTFVFIDVKVDLDHIHIQTVSEVKCMPGQIRLEAFCG